MDHDRHVETTHRHGRWLTRLQGRVDRIALVVTVTIVGLLVLAGVVALVARDVWGWDEAVDMDPVGDRGGRRGRRDLVTWD